MIQQDEIKKMNLKKIQEDNIFQLKNVKKIFRNGSSLIFSSEMSIRENSLTFITGKSGTGKTTLLNILGFLDTVEKVDNDSTLIFKQNDGTHINYLQKLAAQHKSRIRQLYFGYLLQGDHLLNTFSILENLILVAQLRSRDTSNILIEIEKVLNNVGLELSSKRLNQSPFNLSGGQKQRLAIARAILLKPKAIFVDEPTVYLDPDSVDLSVKLFIECITKYECSVIIVSHEFGKLWSLFENQFDNEIERYNIYNVEGNSSYLMWDKSTY